MSTHPTERDLLAFAAGELETPAAAEVKVHLAACGRCHARVRTLRRGLARIEAVPTEATPQRDLWPEIDRRIEALSDETDAVRERRVASPAPTRPVRSARSTRMAPPHPLRRSLRVAAALALFVAGAAVGRITADAGPAVAPPADEVRRRVSLRPSEGLATAVQRAGTEYVEGLASLRLVTERVPPTERTQVRDAAIAAIYGATRELARLAPEDPVVTMLLDVVATYRYGPVPSDRTLSF